jgi:hypothetical protein
MTKDEDKPDPRLAEAEAGAPATPSALPRRGPMSARPKRVHRRRGDPGPRNRQQKE